MEYEYRLRIADGHTPATLPMDQLAAYLVALAELLGEQEGVHFRGVEEGSAVLVAAVDPPVGSKVRDRVASFAAGNACEEARRAFEQLDALLRRNGATGTLFAEDGAVVLDFPGRTRLAPAAFGPFKQDGTLDGQVIRVGGKDDTVPVHLRHDTVIHTGLFATPELARRIAQHLLGRTLRVHGTGTWIREGNGAWVLRSFKISDFEVLEEDDLEHVVTRLRRVGGSRWSDLPDPVGTLLQERHDGKEVH
jgi:hypothetical protein